MSVTGTAPEANTLPTHARSAWRIEAESEGSCSVIVTGRKGRRYTQFAKPCGNLTCPNCGPGLRRKAYEVAVMLFASEPVVWMETVDAKDVSNRQRQAKNNGNHPTMRVPVGPNKDVMFSTYRWKNAKAADAATVYRVFIKLRVSKRQHRSTGRWYISPKPQTSDPSVTISRGFVSPQSFREVGEALGLPIRHSSGGLVFDAREGINLGYVDRLLIEQEKYIRNERKRQRGEKHEWGLLPV